MQALITATVKFPAGKVFDGQYGPSCNVLVTMPDGSETKIWGKPDELQPYRRGDAIALLRDPKTGKFKPVAIAQAPQPAQHPAPQATAPKPELDKVAIADYATQQAKLYSYCYQQARSAMPPDAPLEAVQAAASSVFIATGRKFHL
jgi:hypothetical protein